MPITYLNENDGTGMLAFGEGPVFILDHGTSLDEMQSFIDAYSGDYIFTTLSYDLKSKIQNLESNNIDHHNYPLATLWVPKTVVKTQGSKPIEYLKGKSSSENENFISTFFSQENTDSFSLKMDFKSRLSKTDYLEKIEALKEEIQYGNIYEVNFCQEFYAEPI